MFSHRSIKVDPDMLFDLRRLSDNGLHPIIQVFKAFSAIYPLGRPLLGDSIPLQRILGQDIELKLDDVLHMKLGMVEPRRLRTQLLRTTTKVLFRLSASIRRGIGVCKAHAGISRRSGGKSTIGGLPTSLVVDSCFHHLHLFHELCIHQIPTRA